MYRCLCTTYVSSVEITLEFPRQTAMGVSCTAFHAQQVCVSPSFPTSSRAYIGEQNSQSLTNIKPN